MHIAAESAMSWLSKFIGTNIHVHVGKTELFFKLNMYAIAYLHPFEPRSHCASRLDDSLETCLALTVANLYGE